MLANSAWLDAWRSSLALYFGADILDHRPGLVLARLQPQLGLQSGPLTRQVTPSMAEIIVYATLADTDVLREWINADESVAWIVKTQELGSTCSWVARQSLDAMEEKEYAIWHIPSGPLNIPSGSTNVPDQIVADPFQGWTQTLDEPGATAPWFGENLPGPFRFRFKESGTEAPYSLGRSGFFWARDRYRPIGKPASPAARKWWAKLKRHIEANSIAMDWPSAPSEIVAHVFPRAARAQSLGRHLDIDP